MSAESSELKFVRCPSCKSLVPSVATRCRMCGHQFDATNKTVEKTPDKKEEQVSSPFKKESILEKEDREAEQSPFTDEYEATDESDDESSEDETGDQARRKRKRRRRKSSQNIQAKESNDNQVIEPETNHQPKEKSEVKMSAEIKSNKTSDVSHKKSNGELFAWLIHYSDNPKGKAIEIRSGQFFIGSERLRDADIVIDNDSISTPHVLVKAGIAGGVVVQDLMSEHGTLVKRAGESSYKDHKDPVEVGHGDWLRLGDYEVLVCIVPAK